MQNLMRERLHRLAVTPFEISEELEPRALPHVFRVRGGMNFRGESVQCFSNLASIMMMLCNGGQNSSLCSIPLTTTNPQLEDKTGSSQQSIRIESKASAIISPTILGNNEILTMDNYRIYAEGF